MGRRRRRLTRSADGDVAPWLCFHAGRGAGAGAGDHQTLGNSTSHDSPLKEQKNKA